MLPEAIYEADGDLNLTYLNATGFALFGYTKRDMGRGLNCLDIVSPQDRMKSWDNLMRRLDGELDEPVEYIAQRKDGTTFPALFHVKMISKNDVFSGVKGVIVDLTERKQTEKALREKEMSYRSLSNMLRLMCDNVPDMIWAKDLEKRYVFTNRAMCRYLLNASTTEEPVGKTDMFFAERERSRHPDDPKWHTIGEICHDTDAITLNAGMPQQFDEYGNVKGNFLFLDVRKAPFIDEKGAVIGTVGSARDVTAAKESERKLKESEERYRRLAEDMPAYVASYLPDGTLTYVNTAFAEMKGAAPEELIGLCCFVIFSPDNYFNITARLASLTPEHPTETHDQIHIDCGGKRRLQQWTTRAFFDESGTVVRYQGVGIDITDRKKSEDQIKALLKEKEILLKEVHHRIKNNMATITSLLSLQSAVMRGNPSAFAALQDARSRVRSMMILYDKLYRSSDFREISTHQYLASLIDEATCYFPNRESITVEHQINDFLLDAQTLSPVGIILNELLTNAMKHAFAGRDGGRIFVSFTAPDRHAFLLVEDDGVGIPESIDVESLTGFGLQMVSMMTEQLSGTFRIERNGGSRFALDFYI